VEQVLTRKGLLAVVDTVGRSDSFVVENASRGRSDMPSIVKLDDVLYARRMTHGDARRVLA